MASFVPFLLLFACGLVWGATIPMTQVAVSTGHHPLGMVCIQMGIGAACLGLVVAARRSRIVIDPAHLIFFLVIAVIGTLIPNTFSYIAAFHLPGGVMALVIALVPVFSFVIAAIFRIEVFRFVRLAGVLLGAVAISLLVLPQSSLPDPAKALFVLVGLAAPLFYGIEGNYLSVRQPADTGPVATLFGASLVGFTITLPLAWITGTSVDLAGGIGAPEMALIINSVLHVVAYAGYISLVEMAGAVFASQVAYIVTPAGVLLSVIFLQEHPSPYVWVALVVLMIGLMLVQPRDKPGDA